MKKNLLRVWGIACISALYMSGCSTTSQSDISLKQEAVIDQQTSAKVEEVTEENEEKKVEIPIVENAKQIIIDNSIAHQTVEGFGASYAWYSDWMTMNEHDQDAYDLFFTDAKMTILRFKNTYKYSNRFDPKVELEIYQEAQKRASQYGEEVKVLMSSWSPAAYLKGNDKIQGGASIKKDEQGNYMYKEYGQYWLELVQAYESHGIPIHYVSIQNEIDFVADYDGCEFGIVETEDLASYAKAYLAVYEALQTMEHPPKMMGPETMTIDHSQIKNYMKEIFETAPESVYGIAHHLYAGGTHETPNSFMTNMFKLRDEYPDLSKWQTEFYRGDFIQTAWIIYNSMVYEDLNAYLYWDGVWANPEGLIGYDNPWTKGEWTSEHGYEVHDKYYALRHYSEFIRPGYQRLEIAPTKDVDLLVSAYGSKEQDQMVIVAINKSKEDKLGQISFTGFHIEESSVYLSRVSEGYQKEDLYQNIGELDEHNTILIPAESVMTIHLTGDKDPEIVVTNRYKSKDNNEVVDLTKTAELKEETITIGENNDSVWSNITSHEIDHVANGDNGAKAMFQGAYNASHLFLRIEVADKTVDRSAKGQNQDSVEIYINEKVTKSKNYGIGDHHYRITRNQEVTFGTGAVEEGFASTVTSNDEGYIIELAVPWHSIQGTKGSSVGFEVQVNDSHGKGIRNYAIKWNSTTLDTDQNLEGIGTLHLN